MAEIDTLMLSREHSDIRREAAEHTNEIVKEGLKGDYATTAAIKDARHDVSNVIGSNTDRLEANIMGANAGLTDRFFTVGRDTMDLRAQVIQAISEVRLNAEKTSQAGEIASLKTQIEGQKNTQYLSDRIGNEGDRTRALINELKYHDLNRSLVERNAELVDERHGRRHWRHLADAGQYQGQWAQLQSQVQAFQSQLQETRQGMVNFGTMAGVGQTSTSNNVR